MRDLYHRLGIKSDAGEEEIRRALASGTMDASLRTDAERVLLVPRHRQGYDRAHRLLTTIGQLRTRLDLQLRPFWARSSNQDFTAASHPGHTNPIAVVQSLNPPKRSRKHWVVRFAAGMIAGAIAAFLYWRTRH